METEIKEEQPTMPPSCKANSRSKLQKEMKKCSPIIVKWQSRASLPLSSLLDTASQVGFVFILCQIKLVVLGSSASSEVLTHVAYTHVTFLFSHWKQ